jgi:signal transduction histidine kinase
VIRRLRRIDPLIWDRVLAGLLALGGTVEVLATDDLRSVAAVLGVLAVSATMLLRRVRPLAAPALWLAGVVFLSVTGSAPDRMTTPFLTLWILPYAIGNRLPLRPALLGLALMWAGLAVSVLQIETRVWGDLFFPGAFASTFWFAGRVVRSRSRLTAELHEVTVQAGEAREGEAARAVAEERRRIAREMHDVVAHSVSMMVVQAGGARRILDRDPARAVAAAELIERTGREALVEMRTLLGVLHAGEHAERAPQPTLHELDALVERTRLAGVPVSLSVDGEKRELPAGLDLAAYRVVQEALTNVIKHGGGAPTEVHVHYRADAVEVRVADQGDGAHNVRLSGSGQGLVGMRERVRMYGGELRAGRQRGGGFEVHVRLPLEGEEDAALTAGARA